MPKTPVTKDDLEALAAIGTEFAKLVNGWAKVVESAPQEVRGDLKINGIDLIKNRISQAMKKAREKNGTFENWKRDFDAAKALAEKIHAKNKTK